MPYHTFIPKLKQYITNHVHHRDAHLGGDLPSGQMERRINVLEVGVDTGASTVPILVHLARTVKQFRFDAVDILLQPHVPVMIGNIGTKRPDQMFNFCEGNSLQVLPTLKAEGIVYDLVLLDGDHNYYTVRQELEMLVGLTHQGSVIVVDDYNGKWSERDMWYSERPGYEKVSEATKRVMTVEHCQGVRNAVDDFLSERANEIDGGWMLSLVSGQEYAVLERTR